MWVCPKNSTLLLSITMGILIASGCSGHSVKFGANSEGDELTASEGENPMGTNSMGTDGKRRQANSPGGPNGINGGLVNGTNPSLHSSTMNPDGTAMGSSAQSSDNGAMGEMDRASGSGGANYGHEYGGVNGSGPNHGPVSGFGNGMASSTNPDPETWANAYLRKRDSSREFYGDPSKAETSYGGHSVDGVNPTTWAENYTKENGGPSPEYVNPDMSIAHADGHEAGGSVGMGRTNANESNVPSRFGYTMGASQGNVEDIYFDFDSWNISADAAKQLEEGAHWLQANPGKALTIEGHCDQRGTQDYNLVLGQKRADAAREYLINLGVQPERVKIVSYGKERPFCQKDSEDCFQENRRNHMVVRVN